MTLLWHHDRPIGICVFTAPARALRLRSQYFGLNHHAERDVYDRRRHAPRDVTLRSLQLKRLNQQLWLLARVVVHPTYRGAGVAAAFVRRSCETCPVPWIETLSAMGHVNPFFEKAGFTRVGVIRKDTPPSPPFKGGERSFSPPFKGGARGGARGYAQLYGARRLTDETVRKSRYSEPVYYVFDNRK